jgi:hypothetical protein
MTSVALALLMLLFGSIPSMVNAQATREQASRNQFYAAHTLPGAKTSLVFLKGGYTLTATEIIGQNAHLMVLPNLLEPVLTFSSSTITGLTISLPMTTNTKATIFAQGTVTASGVAIRTSTLSDLKTSLQSSVNPIDLPVLLFGGTVKTLVMRNVNLKINRYLQAQSQDLSNFHLLVSSTSGT